MKTIMKFASISLLLTVFFLIPGNIVAKKNVKNEQHLYTCNCGKNCPCETVMTTPGKCPCGKSLRMNAILKIEEDRAFVCNKNMVCPCGGCCFCDLSKSEQGLCSCGLPLKEVNLQGMYVCACEHECTCKTVSDQPGTCPCGRKLEKVE